MKIGRIIDLSQEIYQGMPVYPGHLKTVIFTHLSHEECARQLGTGFSYETQGLIICDHGPTHLDAVKHLSRDPDAEAIDELSLTKCITPAICIDVSDIERKAQFGADKIKAELRRWNLTIEPGDTVLFYTAHWDRYYGKPEYMTDHPGLTKDATDFILDQGAVNFGVDCTSPDMWYDKTYPCHTVCSQRKVTHYENLAHLKEVVGKRFVFVGAPLKIRGGTGSPVRAVAILDE
jgi:kynurenine formamidase